MFLLIFVVQLLIYGFHELTEANIFPNSQPWHDATEPFGPDGVYGQYFTYLLVLLPLTWLGGVHDAPRGSASRSARRRPERRPGNLLAARGGVPAHRIWQWPDSPGKNRPRWSS